MDVERRKLRESIIEKYEESLRFPKEFENIGKAIVHDVAKFIIEKWNEYLTVEKEISENIRELRKYLDRIFIDIEDFVSYLVDLYDLVSCLTCIIINEATFWINVQKTIYEATIGIIDILGFLLEGEISPESTYEFYVNLLPNNIVCTCPLYFSACNLGPNWGRLTILLNEVAHHKFRSEWLNKYAAINEPIAKEDAAGPHSYTRYVLFPKGTVRIRIYNRHPTDVMYFTWYAHFIKTSLDFGVWLYENVYMPFTEKLKLVVLHPHSPLIKKTKLHMRYHV